MDIAAWISFLEQNRVGLKVEMDGERILEVKPDGKNVDVEIHDAAALKKLRGELKKWGG
jgi:hypothetical protein